MKIAKYELKVIVGTPTYAVPSWLAKKYPDILAVTHNGKELYGHRQNMDITNPDYLHHAQIIIEKLMEQVKDYDCVIGFQLDNETKPYDTCSKYAQAKFVNFLTLTSLTGSLDLITGATVWMTGMPFLISAAL